MSVEETKKFLDSVVQFVEPFLVLANSHMVHYFTHNYEQNILDARFVSALEEIEEPRDLPIFLLEKNKCEIPVLDSFLRSIRENSYLTNGNTALFQMNAISVEERNSDMSDKKSHEVSGFCDYLHTHWGKQNITAVFDIGCGKGHLGQMLSVVSSWEIVGLDVMVVKKEEAVKRLKRLKGVLRNTRPELQSATKAKFSQHSCYISEDTNLRAFVQVDEEINSPANFCEPLAAKLRETEPVANASTLECETRTAASSTTRLCAAGKPRNFAIVGLHTCGNLASVSLKLFVKNSSSKFLANVGCCYHLLEEEFTENPFKTGPIVPQDRERSSEVNEKSSGFPLSRHLRAKKYALGRNARMMASQSPHRLAEEVCPDNIFHRAVLEVIICEKLEIKDSEDDPHSHFTVGRIKKSSSFYDYVSRAIRKIPGVMISEEECQQYLDRFTPEKNKLLKFYYLRNCLAPVIETIILLDRLIFLQENRSVNKASLVQLFNPVTSPRCFAIVAEK